MKPKLTSNIILRVDDELKTSLPKIQTETGFSVSEVVRQSLLSFVDYYNKHKCVVLPISVIPARDLDKLKRDAARKSQPQK